MRDAQPGQLAANKFVEEVLILTAGQLRLRRILYGKDLGANVFDIVPQLTVCKPVGSERINDPKDVAELVIEIGPDDTLRQCSLDVRDFFANLVPDVGYLALWRV